MQAVSAEEAAQPPVSSDAVAAAAEAQMAQHAGDVGEWLGVDSGAAPALQVALAVVPGMLIPSLRHAMYHNGAFACAAGSALGKLWGFAACLIEYKKAVIMPSTVPTVDWALLGPLASPTWGRIIAAFACSLSADAPCLFWQVQRVIIILLVNLLCLTCGGWAGERRADQGAGVQQTHAGTRAATRGSCRSQARRRREDPVSGL